MKLVFGKSRAVVVSENPGVAKIVKVDGGYAVFETMDEYKIWKKQR